LDKYRRVLKNCGSKKKAIVAVARKLAIRLRRILLNGEPYVITHFLNILNSSNEPERAPSYPECKFCDITKEDCNKRVETEEVGNEGPDLPI